MEGYFPINQYCELTGLKKDTAYHRGIRGTIPAFKDAEGRWFFYFCNDEPDAPEGFCTIKEYAVAHDLKLKDIYYAIKCKRFVEGDVIVKAYHPKSARGGRSRLTYIREEAVMLPKKKRDHGYQKIIQMCPEGYIPINAWIEREHVKMYNAYNWINFDYLPCIKHEKHRYIPMEITIDDVYSNMEKARMERKEACKRLMAVYRSDLFD